MKPQLRKTLIYGGLLVTALAAVFAPPAEEPAQALREPASLPAAENAARLPAGVPLAQEAAPPAEPAALRAPQARASLAAVPRDLFHIEPPPAPAVTQVEPEYVAPPPPMAPPLPFVYMGKSADQGRVTVFLTRNNKPYIARLGDVLDGQYRVDAINPPMLEFTYLPLAQKQMLHIGAVK